MDWHKNPPFPFNPDSRGVEYGKAVSREYADFCEQNPESTMENRKLAYKEIAKRLEIQFPSLRERQIPTIIQGNTK